MTIRTVKVSINHEFEVDIPDELLEAADEGDMDSEYALDDLVYSAFEDSGWFFNDMEIK